MDAFQILVIILSVFLAIFLVLAIVVAVYLIKVIRTVKDVAEQAKGIATKANSVVETAAQNVNQIQKLVSPALAGKAVVDLLHKVINSKKK